MYGRYDEFEAAIDGFETATAAALERVARGTEVGVSLDLRTLVRIREAAVGIAMSRLADVLSALREKTHDDDDDDAAEPPTELTALDLPVYAPLCLNMTLFLPLLSLFPPSTSCIYLAAS